MSAFSLGTLVSGMAPFFGVLLVGRMLQASGTAIMLPLLTTTILALVPLERRGAMMGTVSIVISVAPAVGPTISGLIIQALSWRFMFFFVLPIAVAVLAYGARYLQNVGERRAASLHIPSIILAAIGFGGIVYGFSRAGEGHGWGDMMVMGTLLAGFAALAIFVWFQLTLREPLLDLRAFRFPMFSLSVVLISFVMMSLFASALLLPIYLQTIRQFTPLQTGLFLLPGGVLMGLASPFVGRLFDRYGPRALVTAGAGLLTLTLLGFATLSLETPVPLLLALHICFNSGLALLFTPVFATGLNQLPRLLHSHGSAIMSTLQQVAGAVGTALLVTVMTTSTAALQRANPELSPVEALNGGLHNVFYIAAGIACISLVLSFFLRRATPPQEEGEEVHGQPALAVH
jgi:DHA2 family lincomycin resistance protein-like MFS transporter